MARRSGRQRIARPAVSPQASVPIKRAKWALKVGARVKSKAVGRLPAFIGVIDDQWRSGQWFVKDDNGQMWVRSSSELSDPGDEV